jgi:hypothetical protein
MDSLHRMSFPPPLALLSLLMQYPFRPLLPLLLPPPPLLLLPPLRPYLLLQRPICKGDLQSSTADSSMLLLLVLLVLLLLVLLLLVLLLLVLLLLVLLLLPKFRHPLSPHLPPPPSI